MPGHHQQLGALTALQLRTQKLVTNRNINQTPGTHSQITENMAKSVNKPMHFPNCDQNQSHRTFIDIYDLHKKQHNWDDIKAVSAFGTFQGNRYQLGSKPCQKKPYEIIQVYVLFLKTFFARGNIFNTFHLFGRKLKPNENIDD